ncbi:MAG: alpha/beta hydrolase fold protein, partial [Streptosporangiaceae bacterium]|nr:alpha/beta hydrolase fold protein [Streptosporangiaceae bacterium]
MLPNSAAAQFGSERCSGGNGHSRADADAGGLVVYRGSGGRGSVSFWPLRVVYVGSWPVGTGGCINDELPSEDGEVPLPDWSFFDDADLVDLDHELRG